MGGRGGRSLTGSREYHQKRKQKLEDAWAAITAQQRKQQPRMLKLASNLSLPQEAVTQKFSILARSGAGKTYTATLLAEGMLEEKQPIVVIDPIGVWHGLRSHYSIAILGGDHGDIPLEPMGGKLVAEFVVAERLPVILDLSKFNESEMQRFVADFCSTLYKLNKEPLHVFLDEADEFAPQEKTSGSGPACLGAVQRIVRRGRARGLGVTLITQRSAVLNKSVLTQTEVLIAMQNTGPQDIKAIDAWLQYHAKPEERQQILNSLPTLQQGEAYVYSPGWLKTLVRVKFNKKKSADTSSTPKVGEKRKDPKSLKDVDLKRLTTKMAATVERAKANDPTELQKQIKLLKSELNDTIKAKPKVEYTHKPNDVRELEKWRDTGFKAGYAQAMSEMAEHIKAADGTLAVVEREMYAHHEKLVKIGKIAKSHPKPKLPAAMEPAEQARREAQYGTLGGKPAAPLVKPPLGHGMAAATNGQSLPKSERLIMQALVQYPNGCTKSKTALLAGYAVSGGGFNNSLSSLRTKGYLTGHGDSLSATLAGADALGHYDPLPRGRNLQQYWLSKLSKAERSALQVLLELPGGARMSKEELAEAAGYASDGGGFNNALSKLRTLELIEGRGDLKASDVFYEE